MIELATHSLVIKPLMFCVIRDAVSTTDTSECQYGYIHDNVQALDIAWVHPEFYIVVVFGLGSAFMSTIIILLS